MNPLTWLWLRVAAWWRGEWSDPYPGGDALEEYVKSEYEGKPSDEGDQPPPQHKEE